MRFFGLFFTLFTSGSVYGQGAPPAPPSSPPSPPPPPPVQTPPPAPPPPRPKPVVKQPERVPHGVQGLHADFTFGESTETTTTTEDWHVKMRKLKKEHVEDNKLLQAAGHHWTNGVWLYGEYKNHIEGVHSAHECADECEKDHLCLHWCFELEKRRCDLRSEGGGLNTDAAHWITGHAKRWGIYEAELKKRQARSEL